MKTKVHATNSIVAHNREIPEVVEWYIANRLLEVTERLNELLEGRVSSWVDEMRTIRGKTRLSWRILRQVNRTMLSIPERLAYEAYHAVLDVRLWWRWRHLQRSYVSDGDGPRKLSGPRATSNCSTKDFVSAYYREEPGARKTLPATPAWA